MESNRKYIIVFIISEMIDCLLIIVNSIINEKQIKVTLFLQQFEESSNRTSKYSLRGTREFCKVSIILLDCALSCNLLYIIHL